MNICPASLSTASNVFHASAIDLNFIQQLFLVITCYDYRHFWTICMNIIALYFNWPWQNNNVSNAIYIMTSLLWLLLWFMKLIFKLITTLYITNKCRWFYWFRLKKCFYFSGLFNSESDSEDWPPSWLAGVSTESPRFLAIW